MSTTPGTLFDEPKIRLKREIIKGLESKEHVIAVHVQTLDKFKSLLSSCSSLPKLHELTKQIVAKNNEINKFIKIENRVNNQEIIDAIKQAAAKGSISLINFLKLLDFFNDMALHITAAKERLTLDDVLLPLNQSQKNAVLDTVSGIRSLYSLSDKIEAAKKSFQERLSLASSSEAVTSIEEEIEQQDKVYDQLYKAVVSFPSDREAAKAVNDFLSKNPHLLILQQTFSLSEELTDDVLHARANYSASMKI